MTVLIKKVYSLNHVIGRKVRGNLIPRKLFSYILQFTVNTRALKMFDLIFNLVQSFQLIANFRIRGLFSPAFVL